MGENDGTQVPETVTVPKEQYDEMVEKLAHNVQATTNLVGEVKELREKNQLSAAETEDLRKQLTARVAGEGDGPIDPARITELAAQETRKILSERDNETAKENRKSAFDAFVAKHKEFHPDNDEGGIKLASLEGKLSRFNLTGLKSQSDFMSAFEDARNLTVGYTAPRDERGTDPNPLPPNGGGSPSIESVDNTLSSKEQQIVDQTFGGDKERYLKIKTKRPDYVATLLQYST